MSLLSDYFPRSLHSAPNTVLYNLLGSTNVLSLPCFFTDAAFMQARKELAKAVSFSDKHQDGSKAAAAAAAAAPAQAGATADVTLGSAYEKVSTTHTGLTCNTDSCVT